MSAYRYDKEAIKKNPLNRINAKHIADLVKYAKADLQRAYAMPHATPTQLKAKQTAATNAQQIYEERMSKYNLYKELYPELFNNENYTV